MLIRMSSSLDFLERYLDMLTGSQQVWPTILGLTGKTRDTSTLTTNTLSDLSRNFSSASNAKVVRSMNCGFILLSRRFGG